MSELLPLFPLPNVVLFPNVFLPLHIFEPRYREMVADALASDRMIGMVLLRPGWEHDYEGRPPVYPDRAAAASSRTSSGCPTAATTSCCAASSGSGSSRRTTRKSYRRAHRGTGARTAPGTGDDHAAVRRQRTKLEALLAPAIERSLSGAGRLEPSEAPDATPRSRRRWPTKIS